MDWWVDLGSPAFSVKEENRDDFCEKFLNNEVKEITDIEILRALFGVAQSLIRLKIEQVESLELELDDLAAKQGEEEARHTQQLEDLQVQLSHKEHSSGIGRNENDTDDDLQQLLHTSELRAEKLLLELQAQEQERLTNKIEIERLVDQVATIENERSQLKREVLALREEMRDQRKDLDPPPESSHRKHQEFTDSLRQKNKHITQLLSDIETVEKENLTLREKLTCVKTELAEATENINLTTKEMAVLQVTKEEQAERIEKLQQMCEALQNQVEDLVNENKKRDDELEIFHKAIDARVQECKKVLEEKDRELSELYEKLSSHSMQGPSVVNESETNRVAILSQTLQRRENQIEDLQAQLSQATKDINESTSLLEKFLSSPGSLHHTIHSEGKDCNANKLITSTEERIKMLEDKLKDAEKDAEGKSEDITQLIIQLRRYEAGEFGLVEAVAQVKELTRQQQVRDTQIEELINSVNFLRHSCDGLEEQNIVLRNRLGLPPDEDVIINKAALKKKEENLIDVQKQHIDRLEEELVELKMEVSMKAVQTQNAVIAQLRELGRRKLSQQVLMLCKKIEDPKLQSQQALKTSARAQADSQAVSKKVRKMQQKQQEWEIERQSLIEEIEALRQGLHEILDSVHKQDGESSVLVESKGLENLLEALDSRHVSGWYHPAMRLQAQLHSVQGTNASLREQLRSCRDDEARCRGKLRKAKMRITELEQMGKGSASDSQDCGGLPVIEELDFASMLQEDSSISGLDIIHKLNKHLLQVLNEYESQKNHVKKLVSIQTELQDELEMLVSQLACSSEQQSIEKEKREEEYLIHQEQLDNLQAQLIASQAEVGQLKSALDCLSSSTGLENSSSVTSKEMENAALRAEMTVLERKASAALRITECVKGQLKQSKMQFNSLQKKMTLRFGELAHFKKTYFTQMMELEKMLANSASLESLLAANRRADEVTAKYVLLLREREISVSKMNREIQKLVIELETEKQEKFEMMERLEDADKKFILNESNNEKTVQLAAAEARELSEKQRALHAEKMRTFAKAELKEVTERCSVLEQEISAHLTLNHELKLKLAAVEELSLKHMTCDERDELQAQLAHAKAEVVELQTSREQLQELSNIAQDQIQILDQLHDGCEVQLDFLRQTVFQLQAKSDQASIVARLNEDLCASQLKQMVLNGQSKSLETELHRLEAVYDHQEMRIEQLEKDLNKQRLENIELSRNMVEKLAEARGDFTGTLPLSFYQLLVSNFVQYSSECQDLWHQLQKSKAELCAQLHSVEQNKVVSQQFIELQRTISTRHSDAECQKRIEAWASTLSEITLKELKSSRRCEALEMQITQTEERLTKQEDLISALEQQLLSLGSLAVLFEDRINTEKNGETMLVNDGIRLDETQQSQPLVEELPEQNDKTDGHPGNSPSHLLFSGQEMEKKENDQETMKFKVISLEERVRSLTEQLDKRMEELHSYNQIINEMRQSYSNTEKNLQVRCQQLETALSAKNSTEDMRVQADEADCKSHNRSALQATINSLQNIVHQKEETIGRYQILLKDVREEDAQIISALQERLSGVQARLSAQEQAYIRLKNTLRQQSFDSNCGSSSKSALDVQLARTHELEDEVVLLTTKLAAVTAELQAARKEIHCSCSVARQRHVTLEEISQRVVEQNKMQQTDLQLAQQDAPSVPSISSGGLTCQAGGDRTLKSGGANENSSKSLNKFTRERVLQVQIQLTEEINSLRRKLQVMEESERLSKREIQRLRNQVPIYSRRVQRSPSEPVHTEREAELLKKIDELQEQVLKLKSEAEKIEVQRTQQEFKKLKSAENVARWDERKKYQTQIERLKLRVQEQADEAAILNDKVERMHSTIHRLEREKVALEHQLKNMQSLERERIKLENQLKISKGNEVTHCLLEEMQHDRDKLEAELNILKAKQASYDRKEFCNDRTRQEHAALLRSNLRLECENLELKLELEKIQTGAPCLQHNRDISEITRIKAGRGVSALQSERDRENMRLQETCLDLQNRLEQADRHIKEMRAPEDGNETGTLRFELKQKTQLLSKVKVLLERAALKERALTEQVVKLQETVARSSDVKS